MPARRWLTLTLCLLACLVRAEPGATPSPAVEQLLAAETLPVTQAARRVPGVQKVVRVFEIISEQELAVIQGRAVSPGR